MTWSLEKHIYRNMSIPQRLFRGYLKAQIQSQSLLSSNQKKEALPPAAGSPPPSSSTSSPASPLHNHRGQEHRPQDREDHRIFHTWHHGQVFSKTAPRASADSLEIDALAYCIHEIFTT